MAIMQSPENPVLKEKEHVHEIYSQIATHFSDTRYKPWPKIAEFLNSLPVGSIVTDIGCGNGKYLGVNKDIVTIGSDICPELVAIAKGRGHEVLVSDCLSLPYRESLFDAAICIAVLHHLSTEERRREGVKEMIRILRPGGRLLIYVWAMEQNKKKFTSQDSMVPWHMQLKYISNDSHEEQPVVKKKKKWRKKKKTTEPFRKGNHAPSVTIGDEDVGNEDNSHTPSVTMGNDNQSSLETSLTETATDTHRDATDFNGDHTHLINEQCDKDSPPINEQFTDHTPSSDSKTGFKTYYRYYHVFCDGELQRLCDTVKNVTVIDSWYDHENWCILIEKSL